MSAPADSAERIHALLALYRESHYDVELARGGVVTMRIGQTAPIAVRSWLGAEGVGFYLTACNPRSQSLPPEENEQRLESLRTYLRERSIDWLEGAGHIPGETWREPCLLVRGISESDVAELVHRYDQNSILVVRSGAATLLRIYRPDWRSVVGDSGDVEWA